MVAMTVSQARAALPELLTRVEEGEEVTITRHGRAVAVLVRPDVLRARAHVVIEDAVRVHELVAGAAGAALPEPGISEQRAEELIREIRAGRDRR
jgi:antitoxin (DNA-binding transcriptional repressor) of toxin-antitoxin stability system